MKVPVYSPAGERIGFCTPDAAVRRSLGGEGIIQDGALRLKLK